MKIIIIMLALLLSSCGIPQEYTEWVINTKWIENCKTIWGKYNREDRCCYKKISAGIEKQCDLKELQSDAFIIKNF